MSDQDAVIRELQVELMRVTEERDKWRKVADMFHDRHDYGRTCALISRCWECEAYQKAVRGE